MTYPFVAARYFTPGGLRQARAIVLHMAEGTGTVNWLTHPYTIVNGIRKPQDNSSHFVVERSGRIVQMVKWPDADHSLHIARPYGPPGPGDCGIFSLDLARALLGADGIADPNAYLVSVEMEGWAGPHPTADPTVTTPAGPSPAQAAALRTLIDDITAHYGTVRGLLGHRDFQDEKPCPGCGVFDKFAHGAFVTAGPVQPVGADMAISTTGLTLTSDKYINLPAGTVVVAQPDGNADALGTFGGPVDYFGTPKSGWRAVRVNPGSGSVIGYTSTAASVNTKPPVAPPDCKDEKAAYAAAVQAAIAGVPL